MLARVLPPVLLLLLLLPWNKGGIKPQLSEKVPYAACVSFASGACGTVGACVCHLRPTFHAPGVRLSLR